MLFSFFYRRPKKTLSAKRVAEVYEQRGILVLRRCRLLLRDDGLAEDALQEVFERLAVYGAEFEHREIPVSWLLRTAENCCFERLKKSRREPLVESEAASKLSWPSGQISIEAREVVTHFFYGLDTKLMQVALLYYVDGLPQERIAEQLNLSRRTVGKKIAKLRRRATRLKEKIEKN